MACRGERMHTGLDRREPRNSALSAIFNALRTTPSGAGFHPILLPSTSRPGKSYDGRMSWKSRAVLASATKK